MPIPRAASTVAGSTPEMPAYVEVRIGGMPSTTRAISTGRKPIRPISSTISISSPRVGSARAALPTLIARKAPRRVCPISSPTGSAIAVAMPSASAVYHRCCRIRLPMPSAPDQLAGSVRKSSIPWNMGYAAFTAELTLAHGVRSRCRS